ncbi:MAG: aminotransferase class I/II-fold pyridoxal phosphate-dependent enzyme, partial [Rhodanobacteraceae bacterium]
ADAVFAAVTPAVKLVFVCAPGNPAGAGVPRSEIFRLAESLAGLALLVVDEAYVEFVEPGSGFGSVAPCIGEFENLVVLRTLSKAWALAGARVGGLLADARVAALLRKIMPPYPLPSPSVNAALHALQDAGRRVVTERIRTICSERERMRGALLTLANIRAVLPSQANFLAVRFKDADAALAVFRDAGVIVRDVRRYPGLADALRITIGTPAENDRVLAALGGVAPAVFSSGRAMQAEQPA